MSPEQFFKALEHHVAMLVDDWIEVTTGMAPDGAEQYVIIWPSPGTSIDDRTVTGQLGSEATDLEFQVTTAAPTPMALLYTTQQVNAALTDASIGGQLVRPDAIANRAVRPLQDESVRPVRHYMATTWQTQLTRSTNV